MSFSTSEKKRFYIHLRPYWDIHRHRMAPEIAAEIQALRERKRLHIIAASIYYMGSDAEGLTLAYRRRGSSTLETLRPTLVLNCTGPTSDVAASDHRLLKNLRDNLSSQLIGRVCKNVSHLKYHAVYELGIL